MTLAETRSPRSTRKHFIGLGVALFMVAFTLGVVPPMMPAIVREFNSSLGYIQSILVLSSLVTASFTPTTENLSKVFGRKKVMQAGLGFYAIGLLAVATSPHMPAFAVAYALVLGVAASPVINASWALMDYFYDDEAEKKATAVLVLFSIAGGLSGALSGGLIAAELSWRIAFLPQFLMVLAVFLLIRSVYYPQQVTELPIDWVGGLIALMGLGLTLLGVSLAGQYGWWVPKQVFAVAGFVIPPFSLSIVPVLIASGILFLGIFAFWERRAARLGRPSLIRAGLLRRKIFVLGVLIAILHSIVTAGVQFNLYQFIPPIMGLNTFQTALAVFPYTLASLITFLVVVFNPKMRNVSPRIIVQIGLALVALGIFLLYQAIAQPTTLRILPALAVMGVGSGLFFTSIATIPFSAAKPHEKAEASGIYNPLQNVGNSLGRGVFGTLLISIFSLQIVDGVTQNLGQTLDPAVRQTAINKLEAVIQTFTVEDKQAFFQKLPANVLTEMGRVLPASAIAGIRLSFLILLSLSLIALVLTLLLPKRYASPTLTKE
jgi:MFS family permease